MPGPLVRITHTATNQSRESVTNEAGECTFPWLAAGDYDVIVSKDGFQPFTSKGVRVDLDQTVRVNAVLKLGSVNESLVVTADAVSLRTDSAEVRSEVSSVELEDVPIPENRNFESRVGPAAHEPLREQEWF